MAIQKGSAIPPALQPLHGHFRATKRSKVSAPASDAECNPFLVAGPSSKAPQTKSITSTSKGSRDCLDESVFIQPARRPHNFKGVRSLPLSEHHATLLSLHSAVEHALIVHLATSGGSAVDASIQPSSMVQLPSVITYTTLRPIVERSCGRRLGSMELARLMWLWGGVTAEGNEISSGINIGIHVTKAKTMDKTGKKSFDYFFGLQVGVEFDYTDVDEDEIEFGKRKRMVSADGRRRPIPTTPPRKRARPLDLPQEPQTPSPSPRSISTFGRASTFLTPPASPSLHRSPGRLSRERCRSTSANGSLLESPRLGGGNSSSSQTSTLGLVAMWNSGIDARKREVRRRLVQWSVDCYETWTRRSEIGETDGRNPSRSTRVKLEDIENSPSTPPPPSDGRATEGQGGILTPSATREQGWMPGHKRMHDILGIDSVKVENESVVIIREWDAAFPLQKVAPIPEATLPQPPSQMTARSASRRETSTATVHDHDRQLPGVDVEPLATSASANPSSSTAGGPLTLAERIKAKEEAKRRRMDSCSANVSNTSSIDSDTGEEQGLQSSRSRMMSSYKRKSALSRLGDVAESLFMLFSSSAGSTGTIIAESGLQTTRRFPILPISEVTKAICTSSKAAMSDIEARQSITMLQDIAPGYVEVSRVGAKEWIRLDTTIKGEQIHSTTGGLLGAVRRCIRREIDKH